MKFSDYNKYIKSTGTKYIANSGSDENGKYHGGKAGDQTGKEWQLKSWYSRPWSVVLRYDKDARVGYLMACLSCAAALNNKIGYDQYERKTYMTQLEKVGYDPSLIKTACEEDCTAGVTANTKACGEILGIKALANISISTYSKNMKANFKAAGFTALTDKKYLSSSKYLKPGDILLYEGHHAAANVSIGSCIMNSYSIPNMSGVKVPVGSKEDSDDCSNASVGSRTLKNGSCGDDVRSLQEMLLKLKYDLGSYGTDGDFGDMTERAVRAFQKDNKINETGIADENTINKIIEAVNTCSCGDNHKYVKIENGKCYIRACAASDGNILGTAQEGTIYKYGGMQQDKWINIIYNENGCSGWVSAKYGILQ